MDLGEGIEVEETSGLVDDDEEEECEGYPEPETAHWTTLLDRKLCVGTDFDQELLHTLHNPDTHVEGISTKTFSRRINRSTRVLIQQEL